MIRFGNAIVSLSKRVGKERTRRKIRFWTRDACCLLARSTANRTKHSRWRQMGRSGWGYGGTARCGCEGVVWRRKREMEWRVCCHVKRAPTEREAGQCYVIDHLRTASQAGRQAGSQADSQAGSHAARQPGSPAATRASAWVWVGWPRVTSRCLAEHQPWHQPWDSSRLTDPCPGTSTCRAND